MKKTKVVHSFDVRVLALSRALSRAKKSQEVKGVEVTVVVFGEQTLVLARDIYFVEEGGRIVYFAIDEESGAHRYQWGDLSRLNGVPPCGSRTELCTLEDLMFSCSLL